MLEYLLLISKKNVNFPKKQVVRYADLYAATFLNMIYYPFSYMFRAPAMLLPHESTVAHEQRFIMDEPMISRARLRQEPTVEEIQPPHTRPVTPRSVTHNHDEDYSDEESDPNVKSDEDRFNHSSSDEK